MLRSLSLADSAVTVAVRLKENSLTHSLLTHPPFRVADLRCPRQRTSSLALMKPSLRTRFAMAAAPDALPGAEGVGADPRPLTVHGRRRIGALAAGGDRLRTLRR